MLEKYLIIVGAQKCGTTTLYGHLAQCAYFASSTIKELHYFDKIGSPDIAKYAGKFKVTPESQCYLESTPSYLYLPEVPASVKTTLSGKQVKIIICLRNPMERAFSHYQMNVRRQLEPESFEAAFRRMSSETLDSYYLRGIYSEQISRYFEIFGRESVLVLEMEKDFNDVGMLNQKLDQFTGEQLGLLNELPSLNSAWHFKNQWVSKLFASSRIRQLGRAPALSRLRSIVMGLVASSGGGDSVEKKDPTLLGELYREFYLQEQATLEALLGRETSWGRN